MLKPILPLCCLCIVLVFASCKEDDTPEIPNDEEVITTLRYTLTPSDTSAQTVTLIFQDLDGDGGNAPDTIVSDLAANQVYTATLILENETETPAENVTEEIEEEKEEHQFFFVSTVSGMSILYQDVDADGLPVGLTTQLTTGEAGTGELTITLRHEPNKSAAGVSSGDPTNAGGETDIEVTFPITVK